MKSRALIIIAVALCMMTSFLVLSPRVPSANAATPQQIETAITNGLAWLVSQQQADGSWLYGSSPNAQLDVAVTGLAVLKLEERAKELGKDPFNPAQYQYANNVIAGLSYIFSNVGSDSNGVHFPGFGTDVYTTGIAMVAVAASNAPTRPITTGPLAGQTYQTALQGMMNWMAFAQNVSGCEIGGWGYVARQPGWADNSNSGYASLGIGFAAAPSPRGFGLSIPATVVPGLNTFIADVQVTSGPYLGGSIYNPCWVPPQPTWVNTLKTGNLLYELALVGEDISDTRVHNAIGFIQTYWNSPACVCDGGGWMGDYQAMFALMKGLEVLQIQKLTVGASQIDWFDVVSTYIVANQKADGSWLHTQGEDTPATLDTAWALLTLERVVPVILKQVFFDIKPGSCPNPINLKSQGVLPAAICGAADFDVKTIDPATIRLVRLDAAGNVIGQVAPIRWSFEDVATPYTEQVPCGCHGLMADGFMDMTLKFRTQAVANTLKLSTVAGQTVPLLIRGNLMGTQPGQPGLPFEGKDCVRVLKVPKGKVGSAVMGPAR